MLVNSPEPSRKTQHLSSDIRFSTLWHVWPAKAQTSLRICTVWSEPLLVAWIFYECKPTDWTAFGVSQFKRRLHRLVWVYSCQNTTLLEIICHGSLSASTGSSIIAVLNNRLKTFSFLYNALLHFSLHWYSAYSPKLRQQKLVASDQYILMHKVA